MRMIMNEKLKPLSHEVIITRDVYKKLLEAEKELIALKEFGVDNWEGYDLAMTKVEDGYYD